MKTDNFCKENRPEAKKKLRLPDQLELVMGMGLCIVYAASLSQSSRWGTCWMPSPSKKSIGRTESRHIAQWNP